MVFFQSFLCFFLARIFHEFEAFRDAAVRMPPPVPGNALNGRPGLARRVKTFMPSGQNEPLQNAPEKFYPNRIQRFENF